MQFRAISGYNKTKKYLVRTVQTEQIPHTQLFAGPEGSAGLAMAIAFITYLHCTNRTTTDSCGLCSACTKMKNFIHPDLHFSFPIGTTQHTKGKDVNTTHFLSQWRSFLTKNLYGSLQDWSEHLNNEAKQLYINKAQTQAIKRVISLKPFDSTYKVVLVWLPEVLHIVAANTLLKTLEEPPYKTLFVLVTNDITKILPTLRSRASLMRLAPFTDEDLGQMLKDAYKNHAKEELDYITKVAQGNFNKAKKLALKSVEIHFKSFAQWLRAVYLQNGGHLVDFAEVFYKYPLEVQKNWLIYGLQLMRTTLLVRFSNEFLTKLTQQEATFCQKLSKALKQKQIEQIIHQLEKSHQVLTRNAHPKLLLLSTSLYLTKIIGKPQ